MSQPHPKFGTPMTASQYATEWKRSADAFSSAGHYAWMSEQLGTAPHVIEIGCGSGTSTQALATVGRRVLCIESNRPSVDATLSHLAALGLNAEEIGLSDLSSLGSWTGSNVKIINIDAFSPELIFSLPPASFDAVLCWMTGTHPEHIGQSLNISYLDFDGGEMARYRQKIQARSYELGLKALKVEGLVQVVDRAAIRSWAQKDQMRVELAEMQRDLAGPDFNIAKGESFLRKMSDGLSQSNIQYVASVPNGFDGILVLTSTKARLASAASDA